MTKIPYTTPLLDLEAFNCPYCNAYADQEWTQHFTNTYHAVDGLKTSQCRNCSEYAVWWNEIMIYPDATTVELPSDDLSEDIVKDYREAMSIVQKSPRAAAALLRLAIQKLCIELGQSGSNLNQDIKNLVENGLPSMVQKMLDTVRVIGNHSVHPAEINLNDSPEIANVLFGLVNKIAEEMITKPKELDDLYESLPDGDKKSIEKRDGNQKEKNEK